MLVGSCFFLFSLQATKQYDDYYHTALLALVYSDIEKMPIDEQQSWAYDIGIAALLGEKVYNFGELVCYAASHFARPASPDQAWRCGISRQTPRDLNRDA